ncbi:UDP-glucuronosyl/UDP-glucosyltransferase [Macleaya cordata]|uniref:Glycosyltransferase n=1 Tax=Macleaya cordata TaxID=56857 RepID=A0A200QVB7_MACCD|nr:UDP-glucuronosyl/UDP-glucosyltransferase [Macleaya cordata]
MKEMIVLYPAPSTVHIVAMVELGKLILHHHHHHFSVTLIIPSDTLDNTTSTTSILNQISQTIPNSLTLHHLPSLSSFSLSKNMDPTTFAFQLIHLNDQNLLHFLSLSKTTTVVRSLIAIPPSAIHVASQLNIPFYYFYPSNASSLSFFFYLPTLHNQTSKSFKEISNSTLDHLPGLPPLLASQLPEPILNRDTQIYKEFLHFSGNLSKAKGIIVNTFDSLEPKPIKAIADGLCAPDLQTPPRVYSIGPLIKGFDDDNRTVDIKPECLTWLDHQPSRSVVYLCFGRKGKFSATQFMEIATGLEMSGQRFLWVVRLDPSSDLLLPDGFLDRTEDMGLVVTSWVPQVDILSHESVGGFVTHCGWNSVLESVCAGVPMLAWPLYAEQKLNRVVLVEEEMKLAMAMEESEDGFVSSAEVEKRVRTLMESDEGRALREKSWKMREKALAAWEQGGSSLVNFTELTESWKQGS